MVIDFARDGGARPPLTVIAREAAEFAVGASRQADDADRLRCRWVFDLKSAALTCRWSASQ